MELFTNEAIPELLEKSLETARLTDSGWVDVGSEPGSSAGRGIDWLTFEDARASVVDDVRRIRAQAASMISARPIALQPRFLQTMKEISSEHNTTTILPVPIDLFAPFIKRSESQTSKEP